MPVIQQSIPNFKCRTCTKLMGQQFWHRSELSSDLIAIFVGFEDGIWYKIFFDSGILFWKSEPPTWDTQVTDEFHYPIVDLAPRFPDFGGVVEDVFLADAGSESFALRIVFHDGKVLVLNHNIKTDDMDLIYQAG